MNKKIVILFIVAAGFTLLFLAIFLRIKNQISAPSTTPTNTTSISNNQSPNFSGNEDAFKNALNLYIQKKQEGVDMTSGPCLGKIADDWVLDIAHNPRQALDDKRENQCIDYIEGHANHYIELDTEGNLLRSE